MERDTLTMKRLYRRQCDELHGKINNGLRASNNKEQYKILHIDDEEVVLEISKIFLEDMDSSLSVVSESRASKINQHLNDDYDCYLIDYSMSETTGIEVARQIRTFSDKPIILFTSRECSEIPLVDMREMDIDYFQKKPDPSAYYLLSKMIKNLANQYHLTNRHSTSMEMIVKTRN